MANSTLSHREIQVSGLKWFSESELGDAILHYLFGVWADDRNVTYRPKISFGGDVSLRLDPEEREYCVYGQVTGSTPPLHVTDEGVLIVGCQQVDVEQALIRFVKNERIRMLVITLRNHGKFWLWKKDDGEYDILTVGVPRMPG